MVLADLGAHVVRVDRPQGTVEGTEEKRVAERLGIARGAPGGSSDPTNDQIKPVLER